MLDTRKPSPRSRPPARLSRARRALLCLLSAGPLAGCASDNVVVQAVALPPIAAQLMRAPGVPQCGLPARADYQPSEVMAYAKCWEAAYHRAAGGLIGLQRAVAVRERATETALNVAKKT